MLSVPWYYISYAHFFSVPSKRVERDKQVESTILPQRNFPFVSLWCHVMFHRNINMRFVWNFQLRRIYTRRHNCLILNNYVELLPRISVPSMWEINWKAKLVVILTVVFHCSRRRNTVLQRPIGSDANIDIFRGTHVELLNV